jgi:hypothetical protein
MTRSNSILSCCIQSLICSGHLAAGANLDCQKLSV